jgi:hypothetical protein
MEFFIFVVCGVFGIALLGAVILLPVRYRFASELKRKSTDELEQIVFRYEPDYFDYLGSEEADVAKFREITATKNLNELRKNWKKLARSFMKLERKAGHKGRPLIMDYYNWHEMAIGELNRRNTYQH